MLYPAEIRAFENAAGLAHGACALLLQCAEETRRRDAPFRLVLSGGSTPRTLYQILASSEWAPRFDWPRIRFFFGDERCVPLDHPESNYAMARKSLFEPLRIPDEHIARMHGEDNPEDAARRYEASLRQTFTVAPSQIPAFDFVLLGVGDDGHTASLFPGSPALAERDRLVVTSSSPVGVRDRITMTIPLLNQAKVVLFLVTGMKKASIVGKILESTGGGELLPSARIRPTAGRLLWYLDDAAASELRSQEQRMPHHE